MKKRSVLASVLLCVVSTEAWAAERCLNIDSQYRVMGTTENCDSVTGVCGVADIPTGLLTGRQKFSIQQFVPGAGLNGVPQAASYVGLQTIRTRIGRIVLREIGIADADALVFSGRKTFVSGTGEFANVTRVDIESVTRASSPTTVGSTFVRGVVCFGEPEEE